MNRKLKALSVSACAVLVVVALGGMNARAETGGHFVTEAAPAIIKGTEGGNHHLHFAVDGGVAIGCKEDSYVATMGTTTATELNLTPSWSKCSTTTEGGGEFDIEEKGCTIQLTIGKNPTGHNTGHFVCPAGVTGIDIKHPNCTIRVPPQTFTGMAYLKGPENSVTLNSTTVSLTIHHEGGPCIFLGTTHSGTFIGSMVLRATTFSGNPTGLSATG
ncbi:MAG TPA: hypothetical protein VEQ41_03055 [Solirubrobacterales bacterium]|nr:hypothetical protein [Solirubrobacterales bacterium]